MHLSKDRGLDPTQRQRSTWLGKSRGLGLLGVLGAAGAERPPLFCRWGAWSEPVWCPDRGFLTAFALRVEAAETPGDNTAANNVRFRCSDGSELEGPGLSWGEFGEWSDACSKGVCGLQTKIEAPRGLGDDTALNDLRLFCCRA